MIWYCISVLSNNWNQFIMGEAMKLDRIGNAIFVNVKKQKANRINIFYT